MTVEKLRPTLAEIKGLLSSDKDFLKPIPRGPPLLRSVDRGLSDTQDSAALRCDRLISKAGPGASVRFFLGFGFLVPDNRGMGKAKAALRRAF